MSNQFDLKNPTIEEVEALLAKGESIQELLVSVVKMSTTSYSSVTEKYEPNQELIAKQSELASFCLDKGAKLKDAFKEARDIPASFIENNLPLIVSHYDPTEVLSHISWNTYGFNNPLSLITKLIDDHKSDAHKVSYISSELDSSSIEFLLSKGMKGYALLHAAFGNNSQEKQKELIELAFKYGANINTFKDLNISVENCNEDIFKLLMDNYKVSAQDLLNIVVRTRIDQYNQTTQKNEPNQELIAKQSKLASFYLDKGAKLQDAFKYIYEIPASFIENNLPLIVSHYDPTEVLSHISWNTYGFNNPLSLITKLIDDHKSDAGKVSSISSELDSSSIEFLLKKGMKGDALLPVAFANNDKEKQKELFDLAFKYGASSSSFKDLNISVENCNEDIFKLLMDNYKVSAQDLLNIVVRTRIDQYNQTTQKYEPTVELITKQSKLASFYLDKGANLKDAFKYIYEIPASFIENNLPLIVSHYDPTEILSHISRNTYGLNNPLSLITKLIDDHKADAHKVSYISSELDSSSIEFLLKKGTKGNALLQAAFENSDAEKQKALFDLTFKHGATTNSFKDLYISVENCNEDIFKLLMGDYKVSAQDLLSTVVSARTNQYNQTTQKNEPNQELIARQTALTHFLIENGAALKNVTMFSNEFVKNHLQLIIESNAKLKAEHLDWSSFTIEEVETLLKHKISPQGLFKGVLSNAESFSAAIGNVPISEELIIKFKNIIELIKLNNVDTNKVFGEYFKTYKCGLMNSDIFKYLLESKLIEATLALEYAIRNVSIDLANLAFNYQPNINDKSQTSNLTLLDKALMTENLDIID